MTQRTSRRRFIFMYGSLILSRLAHGAQRLDTGSKTSDLRARNAINVLHYGAKGDGNSDDTIAIESAARAARLARKPLYLPRGVYAHSGLVTLNGITVFGDGDATVVLSTDQTTSRPQHAVVLTGNDVQLHFIAVKTRWSGQRQPNYEACGILLRNAQNFRVSNVWITGSACAGIATQMSKDGLISTCKVDRTAADGITLTNGSSGNSIRGNQVTATGDDCISVVSYLSDAVCQGITISENIVTNGGARGITVAGGLDILISHNRVIHSKNAGIQICTDVSHNTRGASNIQAFKNTVDYCGSENPYYGAVNLAGSKAQPVSDILIKENTITNSNNDCIQLGAGEGVFLKNISVIGNAIKKSNNEKSGIFIAGAENVTIDSNHISEVGFAVLSNSGDGNLSITNNAIKDANNINTKNHDAILIVGAWKKVDISSNIPADLRTHVQPRPTLSQDAKINSNNN
ncbi:right-handed parallel beta-helix repeat-containing protein [Paraburkholderia sediminicola]|uniref:right-handed parallel beta-helix repeat-containing protein n=1 Tax=Paraburkholderia sediminicola TaxID=458836 RepID=UPI0038BCC06B